MRRSPRGYALLWILVLVGIVAGLAASAAPYLATVSESSRIDNTVTQLKGLRTGILAFQLVIHRTAAANTLNFPGKISQLTTAVGASDHNSCGTGAGNTFDVAHSTADWNTNGPFATFYVPVGGLWTQIGLVRDSIPARTASAAMFIELPGVQISDANLLDLAIDNGSGDTVATKHGAVGGGLPDTTTVTFRILSTTQAAAIARC